MASKTPVQLHRLIFKSHDNRSPPHPLKLLIAGSAGPIAKQNLRGEFKGWGHEPPNGLWVAYDKQGNSSYGIRFFTKDSAGVDIRPRLAVAMDYFAHEDKNEQNPLPGKRAEEQRKKFRGVFLEFNCIDPKDRDLYHVFRIRLNERLVTRAIPRELQINVKKMNTGKPELIVDDLRIAELKLYYYDYAEQSFKSIQARINPVQPMSCNCFFDKNDFSWMIRELNTYEDLEIIFFLSIKFDPSILKNVEGFKHYDFDSPWIYRVDPEFITDAVFGGNKIGIKRLAHPIHYGIESLRPIEEPDFAWYFDNFEEMFLSPEKRK